MSFPSATSPAVLAGIPASLRDELLAAFNEIERNYRERRWEPSELNGGKMCEVVYTILRGFIDGTYPARASKPSNMVDACRAFEKIDAAQFPRAVRIQVPRVLLALYEVRNNRGVGHVGGDVNPNAMDASFVLATAKWLMAELIRLFHGVDTVTAEQTVDRIVERTVPLVWQVGELRRVLAPGFTMREKTLVVLYHATGWVPEKVLFAWVEHSNAAVFRRDVLAKAHKEKLIEYDRSAGRVLISPLGVRVVEDELLSRASSKVGP